MWSETSYRNAGISRVTFQLIEQLSCRNPSDRFTLHALSCFNPPSSWVGRPNLDILSHVTASRGRKALWENVGSSKEANKAKEDVWLSTAHSVPIWSQVPTATFIHDMIPLSHPEFQDRAQSFYLRFALRYAARRATHVFTNSETTKGEIVEWARVPESKITVIPLGPGSDLKPLRREDVDPNALHDILFERFLLTVGTLEPRKNLPALFEALAMLRDRGVLGDLGLVIVGGRGWKDQEIFDTVARLGLERQVQLLGYVDDSKLAALFASCEAFVFPSLFEGFGMPILEAMLVGAPVLTGDRGAMKEVGGDAARYFDPTLPEDMARAIEQHVMRSTEPREGLVEAGHRRAERFTWESAADKIMTVLRGLVESPAR